MPHILDGKRHLRAASDKALSCVIELSRTVPASAHWLYLSPYSPWCSFSLDMFPATSGARR